MEFGSGRSSTIPNRPPQSVVLLLHRPSHTLTVLLILPHSHPLSSAILRVVVCVHPLIPFPPQAHTVRLVRPHSEPSVPVPTLGHTPIPKPPFPLLRLLSPTSPVPCTKPLRKPSPVSPCRACRQIRIQR